MLQVDFLMSGLLVLMERIDATEALIAIDLDNRRNELVAFDLVSHSCAFWSLYDRTTNALITLPVCMK